MTSKLHGGRWRRQKSLGEGGQGHIFVVTDETGELSGEFALKRLKNNADPRRLERFQREAEILQRLHHPGVIRIVDVAVSDTDPYLVTERHPRSLASVEVARLTLSERLRLFRDVAEALTESHRIGVVHRDVKPDNVLIAAAGHAVVCDFGIAFMAGGDRATLLDEAVGARNYMAPELEDGQATDVTPAADVYSLGKLLYWLASRGRMFNREKHRDPDYDLAAMDEGLVALQELEHIGLLLDKMILAKPLERLKDAGEVLSALDSAIYAIEGGFAPLSHRVAHLCRYCGLGVYKRVVDGTPTSIENFGFTAIGGQPVWHALRCNRCGHIDLFRVHQSEWWGP